MAKKKAVRKRVTVKKVVKRKTSPGKGTPKRTRVTKQVKKTTRVKRAPARSPAGLLGRARVSGTAELDQHFLKDYEARQVFAFLGVKTLKDLESHTPQEIIERLTAPMVQTVNRIRKSLAMQNRCLTGDQKFAVEFKKQMQAVMGR
jgi:hypothetical protein